MDWKHYFDYWDAYLSDWYADPKAKAANDIWNVKSSKLNEDEIPEPYYCGVNPSANELDAVVLNINPGASAPNEITKFWSQRTNPSAFIINDWYTGKIMSYRDMNEKYNPLLFATPITVPGKKWWDSNRFKWLDRWLGANNYDRKRILTIEPCPWHSDSWKGNIEMLFSNKNFIDYFNDYVLVPAADSISKSKLIGNSSKKPYGLWFGSKAFAEQLIKVYKFKTVATWNKFAKKREYILLEGKVYDKNAAKDIEVRFLFMWYPNVGVYAPSADFETVEQTFIKPSL